ncbi:hypothetical protein [Succiniclasticum ruminis]|uniref:Sigma-70, region 4 n=1 Tax=Succiniclasticum ruminis DSM 9236 TaxID=1123323 RepID=A0A1I2DRS3_9FIRM|nr:hypothetical protein [Succiniclasticum ruminis]SFE83198.1 hypothetical protein SAMN05216245_1234 [Succiniclasticum ruminis DSM 9236]
MMKEAKTRYTKFIVIKRRMERLRREIEQARKLEDTTKVRTKKLQLLFMTQLTLLETQVEETYQIINGMKTERMKEITELRYMDGWTWKEISEYTGLSLSRLYQINLRINIYFTERNKDDLLYSEWCSDNDIG